jgi:peptide/nickel transport system substrate-binding protein
MLAALVEDGTLPPVDERLPKNPKVLPPYSDGIGKYGGAWRRGYKGASDRWGVHTTICEHLLEMYQVEGGALSMLANVAESYEVNADGTVFTWNLPRA